MEQRDGSEVARRCVCLELLLQRLGLETDTEEPAARRDEVRRMWLSRLADLGVEDDIEDDERALLSRPVGELSEDELDDLHGRASGALVLLWALGRLPTRPTFASVDNMEEILSEHGLLGDGSIKAAKAAMAGARLRPAGEIDEARAAYERTRGKAKEPTEPEKIVAGVAAHHLAWIQDAEMGFAV
jgi:hypothetical protein